MPNPLTPTQRGAAIVNLFYINTGCTTSGYTHGFDEAAGNAQQNKLRQQRCRSRPHPRRRPDFSWPQQRQHVRQQPDGLLAAPADVPVTAARSRVKSPSPRRHGNRQPRLRHGDYGPSNFDVRSDVVTADDGHRRGQRRLRAAGHGAAVSGHIVLIDRGTCSFKTRPRTGRTRAPPWCYRQQRGARWRRAGRDGRHRRRHHRAYRHAVDFLRDGQTVHAAANPVGASAPEHRRRHRRTPWTTRSSPTSSSTT